jgi:hypothetical protein
MLDSAETMRNGDGGAPLCRCVEGVLDHAL